MFENPLKEFRPKITYPIKIYCIVKDYSDLINNYTVKEIKEYATKSGAICITRLFDTSISEDRHFIEHLPAFHAHSGKKYIRTFYPNTRPLQHIDEIIQEYKDTSKKVGFVKWLKKIVHL